MQCFLTQADEQREAVVQDVHAAPYCHMKASYVCTQILPPLAPSCTPRYARVSLAPRTANDRKKPTRKAPRNTKEHAQSWAVSEGEQWCMWSSGERNKQQTNPPALPTPFVPARPVHVTIPSSYQSHKLPTPVTIVTDLSSDPYTPRRFPGCLRIFSPNNTRNAPELPRSFPHLSRAGLSQGFKWNNITT